MEETAMLRPADKVRRSSPRNLSPAIQKLSPAIQKIFAAAELEFGTKGLDGSKVEHIARQAGISKQLIYHYFKGKDDLYSEVLSLLAQTNLEKLLTIDYDSLDPPEAVRAYITALFDQYRDHPFNSIITVDQSLHAGAQIRHNRDAEKLRKAMLHELGNIIDRGKAGGFFHDGVSVDILHFMAVIIVTGCISSRVMFTRFVGAEVDADTDLDFWRECSADFILRALRA
jgi:AcrR family transcriptional regulator